MLIPFTVVLILFLLWSAYWYVAIGYAERTFAAERSRLAADGISLTCTKEDWGGYPFRFEFDCTSPRIKVKNRAELQTAHLLLVALAYNPWQVVALVDGPSTLTAQGLLPTKATHQRVIASVTFTASGDDPSMTAEIPNLVITGQLSAKRLLLSTRPSMGGGTDIAISSTGISVDRGGHPPVELDQADLLGTIERTEVITVSKLSASRGKITAWGDGTLSIDGSNRPAGKLSMQTNDPQALLQMIEPQLDLTEQQAQNLRMVLGWLGQGAKFPVTAQDGQLFVGPFRVTDLPPLY